MLFKRSSISGAVFVSLKKGLSMRLLDINFHFRVTLAEIMSNNYLDADVSEADAKVCLKQLNEISEVLL